MKVVVLLGVLVVVRRCSSRSWTDVKTYHRTDPLDTEMFDLIIEHDALKFTLSPSPVPTKSTTTLPSILSSVSPSMAPSTLPSSMQPTMQPSIQTSRVPSGPPTSASPSTTSPSTTSPSTAPSKEEYQYPANDPPSNSGEFYFNYNTALDALWGPGNPETVPYNSSYTRVEYQNNAWSTRVPPPGKEWYWNEFDENGFGPWASVLTPKQPSKNKCNRFGKQSPIDVRENWAECLEHHQIRTRRGDFSIYSGEIEAQILPNKLRLLFQRRPCSDFDSIECGEPDPPHADFPNNWGGYTDVIHVDFKLPSEHLLYGERFDGEMQIFHIHPTRRRTPTVVSLMKATRFGYNPILQEIIDEFQFQFNNHASRCGRRLETNHHINATTRRSLSSSGIFTPHHKLLVPSIHFFGYEGSLTEPPCSEIVSWFITDTPMQLSFQQLEQLKRIQFSHVDSDCNKPSVHYRESNARPIQDSFGRPVWRCTPNDFVADRFPFDGY